MNFDVARVRLYSSVVCHKWSIVAADLQRFRNRLGRGRVAGRILRRLTARRVSFVWLSDAEFVSDRPDRLQRSVIAFLV